MTGRLRGLTILMLLVSATPTGAYTTTLKETSRESIRAADLK